VIVTVPVTDKKALHIQARGAFYSKGPAEELEVEHRHLLVMMNFLASLLLKQ
jgi:FMN-dependent NADH-azoreductase